MSLIRRVVLVASALMVCVSSYAQSQNRPLRIAVAQYSHETCTFCPGGDSDIERWTRVSPPYGGERLLNSGGYIGGFVKVAREHQDIELIGLTSPVGVWGGSSASWNTEESFDHFMGLMIADLEQNTVEGDLVDNGSGQHGIAVAIVGQTQTLKPLHPCIV